MGLGAPKNRFKLSNDPNNTAWSRSATKYGQKILQSHGWTPGELLGASGSPYSDLHSAASASHLRITLKDDNLGLGAKHKATCDSSETTGLDVFQDLLGRLNGRSKTGLNKDRMHRSNLRSSAYIDQRWGNLRFVSGGLLAGAESKDLVKAEKDAFKSSQRTPRQYSETEKPREANNPQKVRSEKSGRKKHKTRKRSGVGFNIKDPSKGVNWSVAGAQPQMIPSVEPERDSHKSPEDVFDQVQMDKVCRHAEKAERKLRRRVKREARHSLKVRERSSAFSPPELIQLSGPDAGEVAVASHPPRETNASTSVSQGPGAGRLAVRHRYIQHKKMCMMDNRALNEILMIKS